MIGAEDHASPVVCVGDLLGVLKLTQTADAFCATHLLICTEFFIVVGSGVRAVRGLHGVEPAGARGRLFAAAFAVLGRIGR
jgi:hypothetical protein